jgi:hypothetical protein
MAGLLLFLPVNHHFFTIFDRIRVVSTIRHMINYRFSPDEKLCKEGGKRRISERNRAPTFACNFDKGKTFSLETTSLDM